MGVAKRCVREAQLTQTIVECLKYAATGDLPPNTKGGSFVHDPNLAGVDTVKAQVRLRFRNTSGVRMSCVRNLQVSKKKGGPGITMKTLEGVLGVDDEAADPQARAAISTRCAELDVEMASLLGVSRAIIEDVLFCHQEESSWPLAEPAVLKKRFDDIFEVTRYTKALESIRALRKQRAQDARVDEADLRALQQDKERAESVQDKIRVLERALAQKVQDRDELDEALQSKTRANEALYSDAMRFRETLSYAESLEERLALYTEHRDTLKERMNVIDANDTELQRMMDEAPALLASQRERLAHVQSRRDQAATERDTCTEQHETLLREHARLEAAAQAFQHILDEGAATLRDLSADVPMHPSAAQLEAAALSLDSALRTQLREHDARREREVQQASHEEAQREQTFGNLSKKHNDLHARHEQMRTTQDRLRTRIAGCEADLAREPPVTEAGALEAAQRRRDALSQQEPDVSELSAVVARLTALQAERDTLAQALATAHEAAEQRAQRAQWTQARDEKQRLHEKKEAQWRADCSAWLGAVPDDIAVARSEAEAAHTAAQARLTSAEEAWQRAAAMHEAQLQRVQEKEAALARTSLYSHQVLMPLFHRCWANSRQVTRDCAQPMKRFKFCASHWVSLNMPLRCSGEFVIMAIRGMYAWRATEHSPKKIYLPLMRMLLHHCSAASQSGSLTCSAISTRGSSNRQMCARRKH